MIIMQTKNHNGSSHIGLPEVISAKSPGFLEILLESTWYHFLCAPFTPTPICMLGGGRGKEPSLHPYNVTCVLYVCMYMIDEKMAVFTNASNFLSKVVFLSAPPES